MAGEVESNWLRLKLETCTVIEELSPLDTLSDISLHVTYTAVINRFQSVTNLLLLFL